MPSMEDMQLQQQQKAMYEEQRTNILDQILEAPAKERLSRLAIVKREKARKVEDQLIQSATTGKLSSKVTDEQLVAILARSSEETEGAATKKGVVIQRRKYGFDDDDDDDDDSDLL